MLSPTFLLLACAGTVGEIFVDAAPLRLMELVGLLGFLALEARAISKVALILLTLCIALPAYQVAQGSFDLSLAGTAINRAAFFAFFLTSLSFLQFAANRSPLVLQSGEILVKQRPGRRYLVLTFGAAIMGILLNFSTIGLLGTMISRGVDPGDTDEGRRIAGIRRQRMTLAMLRGFSSLPMWSPITVTMALITAAIPSVTYGQIVIYSLPLAVVILIMGWIVDRFSYTRRPLPNLPDAPSLSGLLPLMGLVVFVPTLAWAVSHVLGVTLIQALLLCLPFVSFGWMLIQTWHTGAAAAVRDTTRSIATGLIPTFPGMRSEIGLFTTSAFLGVLVVPLIDTVALGQAIAAVGLGSGSVLALSGWAAFMLSMIGVSPIISVTILASTLPNLTAIAISPVAVAVSMVSIWSIVVNVTPFSAAVRLSARMIDQDPVRLGLKWNLLYGVLAMSILTIALLIFG